MNNNELTKNFRRIFGENTQKIIIESQNSDIKALNYKVYFDSKKLIIVNSSKKNGDNELVFYFDTEKGFYQDKPFTKKAFAWLEKFIKHLDKDIANNNVKFKVENRM
jgi:hypothetical protein